MNDERKFSVCVNGRVLLVSPGTSVAAAVALAGVKNFRRSVQNTARAPWCGMGICFECRILVDGERRRACLTPCHPEMEIRTDV